MKTLALVRTVRPQVLMVVVVVEYYSFLRNIIVGTPGARPRRFV